MRIKKYIVLAGFMCASVSISHAEVWGGNDEGLNQFVETPETSVPEASAARKSQQEKLAAARARANELFGENSAVKRDGETIKERRQQARETIAKLTEEKKQEYNNLLAFVLAEHQHQQESFVDAPEREQLYPHYIPYKTGRDYVIRGAQEKVQLFYDRQYKPLRVRELFDVKNIKEILEDDNTGAKLTGAERQKYLQQKRTGMNQTDENGELAARRTAAQLQEIIGNKMTGMGSAVDFGSLNLKALKESGQDITNALQLSGQNAAQLGLDGSYNIKEMQEKAKEEFGVDSPDDDSDEDISCKALLCLAGGGAGDSECQHAIREYLSRTLVPRKPWETITKRKNFLKICPTDKNNSQQQQQQQQAYPGKTGFASMIDIVVNDVPNKCSMDRHGTAFKAPFGRNNEVLDPKNLEDYVHAYNDPIKVIRFDWRNPKSEVYPENPAYVYEMVVNNDRLPTVCDEYLAHEFTNIYKTPIYKRVPVTLKLDSDSWLGTQGVNYLGSLYKFVVDDKNNSSNSNKNKDNTGYFKEYRKAVNGYLVEKINNASKPENAINKWFTEVKNSTEWSDARKLGKGHVQILTKAPYVYDLVTKRNYYFGQWQYAEPLKYEDFKDQPVDSKIQKIIDSETFTDSEKKAMLKDIVEEFNSYRESVVKQNQSQNTAEADE